MVIDQATYEKQQKEEKYDIANRGEEESQIQSNQKINEDLYAIVKSDTHYGAYYLITGKKNKKCSCPARVVCKHLTGIKNGKTKPIRISRPSKE